MADRISDFVLNLPILKRIELWAISLFSLIAFNTWDGSRLALLQAEPVEQAIPFILMISDSASKPGKLILILLVKR